MIVPSSVGGALAKRVVESAPREWELPPATAILFAATIALFLPFFTITLYVQTLYPALAAVEDPLPAYEAVAGNDEDDEKKPKDDAVPPARASPTTTTTTTTTGEPVTGSLGSICRLLRSLGGWRANFRGLGCLLLAELAISVATGIFSAIPFLPLPVANLAALVAAAPLKAAWMHVVVTPPSAASSFSRIPPLRRTYAATWLPTVLSWVAAHLVVFLPGLLAHVIGLSSSSSSSSSSSHGGKGDATAMIASTVAKVVCVGGVAIGLYALLVVPTQTALARVNASLLPAHEDTIVPFDRSFGGRVDAEVVRGRGFATFGAALATVSLRSWLRISLVHFKTHLLALAVPALLAAVLCAEFMVVRKM